MNDASNPTSSYRQLNNNKAWDRQNAETELYRN